MFVVSIQMLFDTVFLFFYKTHLFRHVILCGKIEITMTRKTIVISLVKT